MRLPAEQIKQGILHSDFEVRDMSLAYFQCSMSDDPTIMPLFIQAYEQYGWDEVCTYEWQSRPLAQTAATVQWLVDELCRSEPETEYKERWEWRCNFLSSQLAAASVELLAPHQESLGDVPGLDEDDCAEISERIALATISPETAWRELKALCDEEASYGPDEFDDAKGFHYVEAAARDGTQLREQVLATLAEKVDLHEEHPGFYRQGFAADLAGRLRLHEAVPLLLDILKADADDGGEWLADLCQEALIHIGTDDVVRAVAERFPKETPEFQIETSGIFRSIHSDAAVQAGLDLLFSSPDDADIEYFVEDGLAVNLLHQFDPELIEPLRERLNDDPDNELRDELIEGLVVVATLAGVAFPEIDEWRDEMRVASQRYRDICENDFADWDDGWEPADPEYLADDDDEAEDIGEFDGDDGIISFSSKSLSPQYEPDARPIVRSDAKVGRNDPCPCGSGKKFKKCCLNRPRDESGINW